MKHSDYSQGISKSGNIDMNLSLEKGRTTAKAYKGQRLCIILHQGVINQQSKDLPT